jgi:SNF2 family DNA or RNA helicase
MSFDIQAFLAEKFAQVEFYRDQMHPYQGTAYDFLKQNPYSALFCDMGLGKTVTSLTLIVDLICAFETPKVLVIGPLKVATDTWPNEIKKWNHTAVLNYTLIRCEDDNPELVEAMRVARREARSIGLGGNQVEKYVQTVRAKTKADILARKASDGNSVHIINREEVEWLVQFHGRKWPYRTVFIDESSAFKDHTTIRFKALAKVRKTPGLITRMHLLTATPAAETYEHLFAQIYLLDAGERFGKHITKFRNEFFTYNAYSRKYKIRPNCEQIILDKIKDICLVMRAKDYLDLEEPTLAPREVILSEAQMRLYKSMEEEGYVKLPDGTEIDAETAAALSGKLLQMSSGVLYETFELGDWESEDVRKVKRVHQLHDHKIEMLRQIVEECPGEPLLVGYHFKSSLDRLKKAFPKGVAMDKEGRCIKDWNARKIPMLFIHPQSGGHGLNMQKGGHNLIFFDLPWSLELFLQLIGRLARQGQKNPVLVQPLIAKGTLDEYVYKQLINKRDAQELLFRMLKKMIKKAKERQALRELDLAL